MNCIKTSLYTLLIFSLIFIGCNNDDDSSPSLEADYLIFGHFYGFCLGEQCIEIFKIENGKLYEDRKDAYPLSQTFYEGNFELLPDDKYELVKDLQNKVPQALLDEGEVIIGEPDATDGGGLLVEIIENGKRRFWLIDQNKNNVPGYLNDFIDELNNGIAALQ